MFISIAIQRQVSGSFLATAPDLAGCSLEDDDVAAACARLRLMIEGRLADLLLAGTAAPEPQPMARWRDSARFNDASWYEMHINFAHIEAVARHQQGRGRPVPAQNPRTHPASDPADSQAPPAQSDDHANPA